MHVDSCLISFRCSKLNGTSMHVQRASRNPMCCTEVDSGRASQSSSLSSRPASNLCRTLSAEAPSKASSQDQSSGQLRGGVLGIMGFAGFRL